MNYFLLYFSELERARPLPLHHRRSKTVVILNVPGGLKIHKTVLICVEFAVTLIATVKGQHFCSASILQAHNFEVVMSV